LSNVNFCDIYGTFDNGNKFKVDDFQNFLEELKISFDFNYDIESIIPDDNGLYDVNEKLEKTFIKNNIRRRTM
jgi:hypothetical protein